MCCIHGIYVPPAPVLNAIDYDSESDDDDDEL